MMQQFTMQGIANVAAAFARFRIRDARLLGRLAERVLQIDAETPYKSQSIALTTWAYAVLGVREEEMMQALARPGGEAGRRQRARVDSQSDTVAPPQWFPVPSRLISLR